MIKTTSYHGYNAITHFPTLGTYTFSKITMNLIHPKWYRWPKFGALAHSLFPLRGLQHPSPLSIFGPTYVRFSRARSHISMCSHVYGAIIITMIIKGVTSYNSDKSWESSKGLQFNLLQFNFFSWPYSTLFTSSCGTRYHICFCLFVFKAFVSRTQIILSYSKKMYFFDSL